MARVRAWEAAEVSFDHEFEAALANGGFLEAGLPFGDAPELSWLVQLEERAGRSLAPPLLSWLSGFVAFAIEDQDVARQVCAGHVVAVAPPWRTMLDVNSAAGWASRASGSGGLSGSVEGVLFRDRAEELFTVSGGRAFLVAMDAPGLELTPVATQSGSPRWRARLREVPIKETFHVLEARLAEALDRLRVCLAAWAVGAADRVLELSVAYACERHQFDRPIGSYQSVQNRLVDAAIQLTEARLLVHRAAAVLEGREIGPLPRLAHAQSARAFVQASQAAMLTHGGYGFTVDFDVQLFFRRAKQAQLELSQLDSHELVPGFRDWVA